MKKLTLILCLLSLKAFGYGSYTNDKAPQHKFEVSLMSGVALNLLKDFSIMNDPYPVVHFSSLRLYTNIEQWQIGAGYNTQLFKEHKDSSYNLTYQTPHLVLNRISEHGRFSYYAGVMLGYSMYKRNYKIVWHNYSPGNYFNYYSQTSEIQATGGGIVGGLQAGVIFNVYKFISLNGEVGARAREMKISETDTRYIYQTGQYLSTKTNKLSQVELYMPFRIGVRLRF